MRRGLAFGGVACLVAAVVWRLIAPVAEPREWAWPWTAIAAGTLVALITVLLPGDGRLAGRAVTRLYAALAGVLASGWAITRLVADVRGGAVGVPESLLAAGAAATALAALGALAPTRSSGAWRAGAWRAGARRSFAGAALAGAAALAVPVVAVQVSQASQTVAAAPAAPPVARPLGTPWSWQPPAPVAYAVAAGPGVVVALADGHGLVALDGRTGTRRWSYSRGRATVWRLTASPDRTSVLAAFHPIDAPDAPEIVLVVLDAATGRPRWQRPLTSSQFQRDRLASTSSVLPVRVRRGDRRSDDHSVDAWSLADGHRVWSWQAPAGCTSPFQLPAQAADVALMPLHCGARVGVVALDARTGAPRWTRLVDTTPAEPDPYVFLATYADGRVLAFRAPLAADSGTVLLAAADGRVLARPSERPPVGSGPFVEVDDQFLDPATGITRPRPAGGCPGDPRYAVVATSAACVQVPTTPDGSVPEIVVAPWGAGAARRVALPSTRRASSDWFDRPPVFVAPGALVIVPTDERPVAPVVGVPEG